jgi:isoleucyl-tRNA synthetase
MNGEHVTLAKPTRKPSSTCVLKTKPPGKSGTGCVHTAPGHGADDFHIGKQYGLEIYCPVDNGGKFTADVEHFAGDIYLQGESDNR